MRVVLAGIHTRLESELCMRCPQGVTGCCAAPPVVAWADIGRIVRLGGAVWLREQMDAGKLYPCARGLALLRVENPDVATTGREKKCVYHGASGCTIPHDRRSATCNYYVCDDAVEDRAALRDRLTMLYGRWDRVLGDRVVARHPEGPPWDGEFFAWLGAELGALEIIASEVTAGAGELALLRRSSR
jgi:hypothetical protein